MWIFLFMYYHQVEVWKADFRAYMRLPNWYKALFYTSTVLLTYSALLEHCVVFMVLVNVMRTLVVAARVLADRALASLAEDADNHDRTEP